MHVWPQSVLRAFQLVASDCLADRPGPGGRLSKKAAATAKLGHSLGHAEAALVLATEPDGGSGGGPGGAPPQAVKKARPKRKSSFTAMVGLTVDEEAKEQKFGEGGIKVPPSPIFHLFFFFFLLLLLLLLLSLSSFPISP